MSKQPKDRCEDCGCELSESEKIYCNACMDNDYDEEQDFEPCCDCDLPDACADFGCAIKNGIRKPSQW